MADEDYVSYDKYRADLADIRTTLARIETLLARVLRGESNGRDA